MENNKITKNLDNNYKSNKQMAKEARRKNKDTSPRIEGMKGVRTGRGTIVFPKTQERYDQLMLENEKINSISTYHKSGRG